MDSAEGSTETAPSGDGSSGVTPAQAEAAESVLALLGDLRHVVGRMPHDEWPEMSKAVLEHHDPPIDEALLNEDQTGLQTACRDALRSLIDDDYVNAKTAIERIRRHEVRLGLELEDLRTEDA